MDWISVKDRLPDHGRYLTYCQSFFVPDVGYCEIVDYFCDEMKMPSQYKFAEEREAGWWDYENEDDLFYRVTNVTHWMPLPEPPKEGEG